MKRRKNETIESYRKRRKKLQSSIKNFLRGRLYNPKKKEKRVFPNADLF